MTPPEVFKNLNGRNGLISVLLGGAMTTAIALGTWAIVRVENLGREVERIQTIQRERTMWIDVVKNNQVQMAVLIDAQARDEKRWEAINQRLEAIERSIRKGGR